jgi:pimeloyl-ACP methyl ester carboxylesterase
MFKKQILIIMALLLSSILGGQTLTAQDQTKGEQPGSAPVSSNLRDPKPEKPGFQAPQKRLGSSASSGCQTSPFTPPQTNDTTFVTDCDTGLDTGCTFRSEGPLVFTIKVNRFVGDVQKLKANGLISQTATLQMPAFDVDFFGGGGFFNPERDRVSFNGHVVPTEFLQGDNNVWQLNEFEVPIEWVNFPSDPGAGNSVTPADNVVQIDIDTANSEEVWCTAIDWGALAIKVARPVVMVHGILSSGGAWDQADFSWVKKLFDLGIPHNNEDPGHRFNMGNLDSIQNNAGKIANEVANTKQRWGVDKVDIVAHSKGGIDSRHFVESNDSIERLVQLGTPNAGSPLADVAQGILVIGIGLPATVIVNALAGPAGVQLTQPYMRSYNLFHGSNPKVNYTALAGDYDPNCFFLNIFCRPIDRLLLLITGRGDTIVPVSSVHALSYTQNRLLSSKGNDEAAKHTSLNHSARVYNAVNDQVEVFGMRAAVATAGPDSIGRTASFVGMIQQGQVQTIHIPIDQATPTFISLMYPSGNLDLALISPSGQRFDAVTVVGNPNVSHDEQEILGGFMEAYNFAAPEVGIWTVEVSAPSVIDPSGSVTYAVNGWIENPAITFQGALAKANVHLGESLQLLGTLKNNGAPLTNATVRAKVAMPDNTLVDVALHDDGTNGDTTANDGVYTGTFTATTQPGNYRINFIAGRDAMPGIPAFSREDFTLATVSSSASTVAGPFKDHGVDTDGDGFFNQLVIEVGLNITAKAKYRVLGVLKDSQGNTLEASAEAMLDTGTQTVALQYDGVMLFNNRVDGPYTLATVRLAEEGELEILPVDERNNVYQTATYSYSDFQHSAISLTGNGFAEGVDTNGNNLFDLLNVGVEVDITHSGFYNWSARLTDQNDTEIGFFAGSGSLKAGLNMLGFTFDGEQIGHNGVDGPYLVRGLLVSGAGDSLVISQVFTTGLFLANQFEGFVNRCASDSSAQVSVTRGGFRFNRLTGHFMQMVTLKNTGASPIQGPVSLVLDNLSSNAKLSNQMGVTTCAAPLGSSYIDVNVGSDNVLSANESATVALEFTNSSSTQGISYNTRVLTGSGNR